MSKSLYLTVICALFFAIGCSGPAENEVPQGLTAPTAEETKAAEDYTKSMQLDPKTGAPVGN